MQVSIDEKKKTITVEIPLEEDPQLSKKGTGNNFVVASTGGYVPTGLKYQGKPLKVNVMAIVPK